MYMLVSVVYPLPLQTTGTGLRLFGRILVVIGIGVNFDRSSRCESERICGSEFDPA